MYNPYQPNLYQPNPYQPYQYQPIQQQANPSVLGSVQATQMPVDERIWVQGENAATAYLVAANGFVRLWDSTQPVFYEKQADATGKPMPMVVYDYKRRGGEPLVSTVDYTEQIDALKKRLDEVEKRLTAKKPTKKEGMEDE